MAIFGTALGIIGLILSVIAIMILTGISNNFNPVPKSRSITSQNYTQTQLAENKYKIGKRVIITDNGIDIVAITINNVTKTDYRHPYEDSIPADVIFIDYTYENLLANSGNLGNNARAYYSSYMLLDTEDFIVLDSSGKLGTDYPGKITKYPYAISGGESCDAEMTLGLENPSNNITIKYKPSPKKNSCS